MLFIDFSEQTHFLELVRRGGPSTLSRHAVPNLGVVSSRRALAARTRFFVFQGTVGGALGGRHFKSAPQQTTYTLPTTLNYYWTTLYVTQSSTCLSLQTMRPLILVALFIREKNMNA